MSSVIKRCAFVFSVLVFAGAAIVRAEDPAIISSTSPVAVPEPPSVWRTLPNAAFSIPEALDFVIRWGVVTAGHSSLNVEALEFVNGRAAYHLVSEAHSTGVVDTFYRVNDRNEAWLDRDSLTSVQYSKRLREGSFQQDEMITMDQPHHRWSYMTVRLDKKTSEKKEGPLPPDALDVQSSLYLIRTMPLEVGKSFSIDVHSGDKVYPLTVNVRRREKITVHAGTFDCFLVEPLLRGPGLFISKGKKLEVWLTTDARHMPVRMRSEVFFGHVAAELISYHSSAPEAPAHP
jgi:hypothetical protein